MNPRTVLLRTFATCVAVVGMLAAGWASADPPSRVARLSYMQGVVSFAPAGADDWVQARLNRPLVQGDRLWTDNDARAELQIGVGALRLAEYTSVSLLDISNRITQLQLAQGTLSVRVRQLRRGETVEIATPNLAFAIDRPGEYRIAVDPRGEATTIFVRSGEGQVFGDGVAYELREREAVRFHGANLADPEYLAFDAPDPFERWARERERRVARTSAARYVAPEVIGYEDLDAYGSWRAVEGYGTVWTPRAVAANWAPYSTGHWSFIQPYGWTWVDDAPWGFAPYHYGRWAHLGGSWSWVPGPRTVRPVYAPALVAFVGGSNFRVSIASGPAASGIAWFPLAPGEVYRPAYNVTPDYFRNVNVSNTVVSNTYITNVYNQTNVTEVNYRNRQVSNAITAVPAAAFAQSQPVHRVAVPVNREEFARAQVITSPATVAPAPVGMASGAAPASQKPAPDVLRRAAVVREAPQPAPQVAPAPQGMGAQQQAPGRAPERAPVAAAPATPAPAPNVRVVGTETPKPMPARSRERDQPAPPGAAPMPQPAFPPAAQPGVAQQRAAPPTPAAAPPAAAVAPPAAAPARPQDANERRRDERRVEGRPAPTGGDAQRAMQPATPGAAVAPPPPIAAPAPVAPPPPTAVQPPRAPQPAAAPPQAARPAPAAAPPVPPSAAPSAAPTALEPNRSREQRGNAPPAVVPTPPAPPAVAPAAAAPPRPSQATPPAVPQPPAVAAPPPAPKPDGNLQRRGRDERKDDPKKEDDKDEKKNK